MINLVKNFLSELIALPPIPSREATSSNSSKVKSVEKTLIIFSIETKWLARISAVDEPKCLIPNE